MPIISLLLPTRARPALLLRFLQSLIETSASPSEIEVVIAIDEDDASYQGIIFPQSPLKIVKITGKKTSMGTLNTRCLKVATGTLIMLANDDLIMRTPGWDRTLIQASQNYKDGIFLIHVKDGMKNRSFPCFPILSRTCLTLLEDPFPALYQGDGIDNHIYDIFLRLKDLGHNRIHYIPDVLIEHMHAGLGKATWDTIYETRSPRQGTHNFHSLWQAREALAQKLHIFLKSGNKMCINLDFRNERSALRNIIDASLRTKQTASYKSKYGTYHICRELYLLFGLHHLKRIAIRWIAH